jgi:hypothetical protein
MHLKQLVEALVPFPHHHRRPDLTSRPLRFTNVGNYLIAYAPDKRPLWVVAIMHGRRNPRVMAAILERPREVVTERGSRKSRRQALRESGRPMSDPSAFHAPSLLARQLPRFLRIRSSKIPQALALSVFIRVYPWPMIFLRPAVGNLALFHPRRSGSHHHSTYISPPLNNFQLPLERFRPSTCYD